MAMERPSKQFRADERHSFPVRPAKTSKARQGGRQRVQRCLEILRLLTTGQEWPARRLSEAFDVTHRTIQRDMELLENAGLVVRTNRQRPHCYRLAKETTWERPQWSLDEFVALLSLAGRGFEGISAAARAAAMAAIARNVRLQAAAARQPLEELVATLAAQPPHLQAELCGLPWLGQLIAALVDHRALRVFLRDDSGSVGPEPHLLVADQLRVQLGQWIVSAYKVHGSELMTVTLESIASVEFDVDDP
jgi:DNA-binding transcriptional ArsR family regulator